MPDASILAICHGGIYQEVLKNQTTPNALLLRSAWRQQTK